jgi:hypothetical protein
MFVQILAFFPPFHNRIVLEPNPFPVFVRDRIFLDSKSVSRNFMFYLMIPASPILEATGVDWCSI